MTEPAVLQAELAPAEAAAPADVLMGQAAIDQAQDENPLKRPADDETDGPDAKRLHVQEQPAYNGVSAEAGVEAAGVDAAAAAAGVDVKQELEQFAQPQYAADNGSFDAAGADAAPAVQPVDVQVGQEAAEVKPEVKQEPAAPQGQQRPAASPSQRGGKSGGIDLGSFKLPADVLLKQEIPLPRRMASCVIGIKGQSVSKLRRESGSKIHVRPGAGREELDQVVEIEGNIDSVSACVRMIADLLRSEDPGYKMVPKPLVTSRFLVLPEMIGPAIIGKGGTHAKHIKDRTGVRIEVVPAQSHNQARQEIVLHGPPDRVREAYHLLLGNIRKYGPSNLPAGAVPNPMSFPRPNSRGSDTAPPWRSGREAYSPSARAPYGAPPPAGRAAPPPPPPPPRGGAPPPYRPYEYAAPPPAPYGAADPYRAPPAAAPYAAQPPPPAPAAAAYQAADPNAAAAAAAATTAAAAGGQQMMYILQDGVLKPLTVMYQQGATTATAAAPTAAPVAQTTVLPATYAAAPAATGYGTTSTVSGPASTGGGTTTATLYQQPAAAATTQYTYAVPSTDTSGGAATWTVQQVATSAPVAAAPQAYTTATGYQTQTATQYAAAPAATQYYYQPQ